LWCKVEVESTLSHFEVIFNIDIFSPKMQDTNNMAKILIIDDDEDLCRMLADLVGSMGHEAAWAVTLKAGLEKAGKTEFDVVFLDVNLPDGSGLDILLKLRQLTSSPEVIIVTGAGDPDGAETAIRNGAWDYVQKPLTPKTLILPLSRVCQYRDELKNNEKPVRALRLDGIVGDSRLLKGCMDGLAQAANSDANILITGETGTGKELFARAIHLNSRREKRNFVVVDCAALPDALIESTLFGHEKGAFTDAARDHTGLVKQADGGTLFLDEVGELPLSLQKSFLRVLQEKRFRPVGGKKEIDSDFRLVAATNRNLNEMVDKQQFRKDLLYRLCAIPLVLPPLRDRIGDINALVMHYVNKISRGYGLEMKGVSPDFLETLTAYPWPGNVRELVNTIERVIAETRDAAILFSKHLPSNIRIQVARDAVNKKSHSPAVRTPDQSPENLPLMKAHLDKARQDYLEKLMIRVTGNIKEACRISGLSRSGLYQQLGKYEIPT
jgi:two-component system, NtrC family, response regulator